MKRNPISKIFKHTGLRLARLTEEHKSKVHNYYSYIGIFLNDKLIAVVGEDDLFDADGNRFTMDE